MALVIDPAAAMSLATSALALVHAAMPNVGEGAAKAVGEAVGKASAAKVGDLWRLLRAKLPHGADPELDEVDWPVAEQAWISLLAEAISNDPRFAETLQAAVEATHEEAARLKTARRVLEALEECQAGTAQPEAIRVQLALDAVDFRKADRFLIAGGYVQATPNLRMLTRAGRAFLADPPLASGAA